MNKEFVPYELAVKLKELGFDEPCLFAFDNCSTPMRCTDLRTNEQKFNGVNYNSSTYTSQPTFSQVFRWFRDKKGLHGIYTMGDDWNNYYWQVWRNDYMTKTYVCSSDWVYETYEEAEVACLTKLIEIVQGGSHE
jgi:hypothetical protein